MKVWFDPMTVYYVAFEDALEGVFSTYEKALNALMDAISKFENCKLLEKRFDEIDNLYIIDCEWDCKWCQTIHKTYFIVPYKVDTPYISYDMGDPDALF